MSNILLSICIPTNGRIDILKNTLDSIFSQAVDFSEFEVVLSDNSETDELSVLLRQYSDIPNIVYEKTIEAGFLNSINALRMGRGEMLKLHNNYSELKNGSLSIILESIRKYQKLKPTIFFTNGSLRKKTIEEYRNFDEFMYALSYFSSWSNGFSIWDIDFQKNSMIEYNKMFPHTSLLFKLYDKNLYVINDEKLFNNQSIMKKGGYNLFDTFAVKYLEMVEALLISSSISKKTFRHIKFDLCGNFLTLWYCNTKILKNDYTYDLSGVKKSMLTYYSTSAYYKMVFLSYLKAIMILVKRLLVNKKSIL